MLLHRARKVLEPEPLDLIDLPDLSAPLLFTLRMLPDGTTYDCHNVKNLNRQTAIGLLKPGDPVVFQEGKWEGEKVLWVLTRSGTDIGAFPKPFIDYLNSMVKDMQMGATVDQTVPLALNIEVHGEYKKKWKLYDGTPLRKEYIYGVSVTDEYMKIPPQEILCDLVQIEDTMVIKAAGMMIGTINPKKVGRLQSMLDQYDCVTTVYADPHNYNSSIKMVLRF